MRAKYLVILLGATGTGKSSLGVEWGRALGCEVVSVDARQLYKPLFIGTAQLSQAEMKGVRHHMMGVYPLSERFSAGRYAREVRALLKRLYARHDVVLLVGGTGFYIDALCNGLPAIPEISQETHQYWRMQYQNKGLSALQSFVKARDKRYYAAADIQNPARMLRAATVIHQTGVPYSEFAETKTKNPPIPYQIIKVGLWHDRAVLYRKLNERVDDMMRRGLYDEAKTLYPKTALVPPTHGYQELFAHFEGHLTLDEAVERIKRNTRRYAKRQYTWFGQDPNIQWLRPHENHEEYIHACLEKARMNEKRV